MKNQQILAPGLQVRQRVGKDRAIISVGGPLKFPDAVHLTAAIKQVIKQHPPVVLLDLTHLEGVDATGVAVLVGIGGDLKTAGIQARIIASDPLIRHRLPYTLGLRRVFTSVEDAIEN